MIMSIRNLASPEETHPDYDFLRGRIISNPPLDKYGMWPDKWGEWEPNLPFEVSFKKLSPNDIPTQM